MTRGATEVHETAFGQKNDAVAGGEFNVVDLRFDVFPLVLFHGGDVNFAVEMADVADDGLILHANHMIVRDHVVVTGGCDKNVCLVGGPFHRDDAVAFHGGLQGADRVDFGNPDLS